MGRVYAVASGKGGVGKTTTTANLGAALAAAGHDVVVVDADLGMPNLAGTLGVDPAAATIHDVLAGAADVADATYEGAGGVSVVPGSEDVSAFARSDPEGLDDVLDALSGYDFVLLDTGASLTHVNVRPLAVADGVLLVSTTEPAALSDTDRTREVARRVGGAVAGAVLTRVDPANPNAEEVDATLDAEVLEVAPEDPAVGAAMAAGEPLAVRAPDSPAAEAYRRLAAQLSGDADSNVDDAADADGGANGADGGAAASAGADAAAGASDAGALGDVAATDRDETDAGDRDESAEVESEPTATDPPEPSSEGPADPDAPDEAVGGGSDPDDADVAADADAPDADDGGDGAAAPEERVDGTADAADDGTDAPTGDDGEVGDEERDASAADEADGSDGAGADASVADDAVSETVLAGDSGGGLVEEAEPGESPPAPDEGDDSPPSAGGVDGVPDAESGAADGDTDGTEGEDEEEDGDGKGFFRRLLG